MIREDLAQIAHEIDPRPAARRTTASEAVAESVRSMWAESNAMTLRNMEQRILEDARSDYVRATGRSIPDPPPLTEEILTNDGRAVPLTEKNWLLHQISKLPPDEQRAIPTEAMIEKRLLDTRDAQIREANIRIQEASPTAQVVGTLAGGAIAGITDPFTVPFLPFGGFARPGLSAGAAALRVGLTEAAIGGATAIPGELINASFEERSGRKASIERAVANVGLAALGGFAFGGLIEGGTRIGKRLFNNYRIKGLDAEVRALRDIEQQADTIAMAFKRAGVEMNIPAQRKAATEALDAAIIALRNNDLPTARVHIAVSRQELGTTPAAFAHSVKQNFDDPKTQKLILDAEKAGQEAKQAAAKANKVEAEAAPVAEGTKTKAQQPLPENEVVKRAFEARKVASGRITELNRDLPEGVRIGKDKTSPSGYSVKKRVPGEGEQRTPVKDINSQRSVSAALRSANAFERPPLAEPTRTVADSPSLSAREARSATYQGIEIEDHVAATEQGLKLKMAGRETEKIFVDEDAEGNLVARSYEDLKAADAQDDFLAEEFKGCVFGG